MEYRFEGTDRFPDIMFTDDKIQDAKGNECYYNDIEKNTSCWPCWNRKATRDGKSRNGLWCSVDNNKST